MSESMTVHIIARIRSDFGAKFGIPRQSGLVDSLTARVIFEPELSLIHISEPTRPY